MPKPPDHSSPAEGVETLRTSRLEALSDGVFSIAMTLLILQIGVPSLPAGATTGDLWRVVVALGPKFFSYVVSFLVIGMYWEGQHAHFHLIRRADPVLIWLTLFFLMLIAAIPFSAQLTGRYLHERVVVLWYGGHVELIGAVNYLTWRYASKGNRLLAAHVDPPSKKILTRLTVVAPVLYAGAIALAFVSTAVSLIFYLVVPLAYVVLPGTLGRVGRERESR